MPKKTQTKKISFEQGITILEQIAEEMEEHTLPLDVLLKKYEDAMTLSYDLQEQLQGAKARMKELVEKDKKISAEEFDVQEIKYEG